MKHFDCHELYADIYILTVDQLKLNGLMTRLFIMRKIDIIGTIIIEAMRYPNLRSVDNVNPFDISTNVKRCSGNRKNIWMLFLVARG